MTDSDLKRLNIELSANCSYACAGCPNTYMQRPKGHMSVDLFRRIYDEIDGRVEKVFLWNYGESLLNPSIGVILNYTAGKSPKTALSSTGYPLSFMKSISELGSLDEFIISINGFDEETYNFHQRKGNFAAVLAGLERVKPIMAQAHTNYVLQTVVNSRNISKLDSIDQFARQYGFKKIVLKLFNVMDTSNETKSIFVPADSRFSRYAGKMHKRNQLPCLDWMVINWDGDVNICCWDYKSQVVPGNVVRGGVFGVWNSDAMRAIKKELLQGKFLGFCIDCTSKTTINERDVK